MHVITFNFVHMQEQEINTQYAYYACNRVPYVRLVYLIFSFGIVVTLLAFALFMAFKTRKVQIKGLNDAKFITAIVYVGSLSCVVLAIVTYTFENRVNTYPASISAVVLLSVFIIQGLVFIPKVSLVSVHIGVNEHEKK